MYQALKSKILLPLKQKFINTLRYVRDVFSFILLNLAIMPTMVYLTAYLMQRLYQVQFGFAADLGILKEVNYFRLLFFFLMVGCAEEGLFRYMLYDRFLKGSLGLHRVLALIISSVAFGAAHLGNSPGVPYSIPQATGAAFAGILFGYLYEKRGLHFAILVHGGYDILVTLIYLVLRSKGAA